MADQFGFGMAVGIGCGFAAGIGAGMASGMAQARSNVKKQVDRAIAAKAISVTTPGAQPLSGEALVALLERDFKKP